MFYTITQELQIIILLNGVFLRLSSIQILVEEAMDPEAALPDM